MLLGQQQPKQQQQQKQKKQKNKATKQNNNNNNKNNNTLSGPTAWPLLSRCRVPLYLSHVCFSGIAGYRAIPRQDLSYRSQLGRVAGGIAAQVAVWRVSRYTGVSLR